MNIEDLLKMDASSAIDWLIDNKGDYDLVKKKSCSDERPCNNCFADQGKCTGK